MQFVIWYMDSQVYIEAIDSAQFVEGTVDETLRSCTK